MAILKIARMGHPVLLQRCAPVADPGAPEVRRLVADMIETMDDAIGVGLAAPQVHVPLRLFVFRIPERRRGDDPLDTPVGTSVLINPEVELLGDWQKLRVDSRTHIVFEYKGLRIAYLLSDLVCFGTAFPAA